MYRTKAPAISALGGRTRTFSAAMLLQASTCLLALLTAAARATIVHIDGNGPQAQNNPEQSRKATFVNQLSAGDCNLYWVGAFKSGPRLFYGPLAAKGGERGSS